MIVLYRTWMYIQMRTRGEKHVDERYIISSVALGGKVWTLQAIHLLSIICLRSRLGEFDSWHESALGGSRCSLCRKLCVWSQTSWIESDSSHHPISWALCKWRASLLLYFGSCWHGISFSHSCRPEPWLQMWSISSSFWWSWLRRAIWYQESCVGQLGKWCMLCWHLCQQFPIPETGCHYLWYVWCDHF